MHHTKPVDLVVVVAPSRTVSGGDTATTFATFVFALVTYLANGDARFGNVGHAAAN